VHHFDIKMTPKCEQTEILMDGRPLTGVHAFKVECAPGQVTKITLELAGTASLVGNGQVWVKDTTQELTDRADVAEGRAHTAEDRADVAEARADAAEAGHGGTFPPPGSTLAYIVPVETVASDDDEGKPLV
jgi:hypothetical protein